ncbi:hypothetical protein SDC9_129034 [bioreactor metagenome]|uniref:Uncharacterized protein n=1 Tax=bioreactor metagenome TaxID=1076179 RepID=A0A645CXV6_9ZZZZ
MPFDFLCLLNSIKAGLIVTAQLFNLGVCHLGDIRVMRINGSDVVIHDFPILKEKGMRDIKNRFAVFFSDVVFQVIQQDGKVCVIGSFFSCVGKIDVIGFSSIFFGYILKYRKGFNTPRATILFKDNRKSVIIINFIKEFSQRYLCGFINFNFFFRAASNGQQQN